MGILQPCKMSFRKQSAAFCDFHSILFVLGLLLSAPFGSTAHVFAEDDCEFPAIFNFGDSNSDTGGLSAAFGAAPPPNGESFFHKPAGRYCDGRLVIDFIGASYKELLPKLDYFNKALYTFDVGQNDLTAGYFLNMTVDQVKAFIPDLISQFSPIIKNIYFGGGRSFLIHNTGPVGCLPYILDRLPHTTSQMDRNGCATPYNEVAQDYNKLLKEAVIQLRTDLPMAAITYVDMHSIKYGLITN